MHIAVLLGWTGISSICPSKQFSWAKAKHKRSKMADVHDFNQHPTPNSAGLFLLAHLYASSSLITTQIDCYGRSTVHRGWDCLTARLISRLTG